VVVEGSDKKRKRTTHKHNNAKKMKITGKIKGIFSHAVALDQNGGLRNTIYGLGRKVFIMNYDHTVLLSFDFPKGKEQKAFDPPISFKANDYDSNEFKEEGDKIVFTSEKNGYLRTKTCGTTELTPMEVEELYEKYTTEVSEKRATVTIDRGILELLDDSLSHIEFTAGKNEEIRLLQRNIYSGGIIEVQKAGSLLETEAVKHAVGPVALKTGDFQALFSFTDILKFHFPTDGNGDFVLVEAYKSNYPFKGVIACCLYDEIIEIKEAQTDGRKKQKVRRSK
jgi:hypothetical protein